MDPFDLSNLAGVIDMHIHSKPDVRERRYSDLELAEEAKRLGVRAIVVKTHVMPTAARAWLVEQAVPGVRVFGGIALNREVGGLNKYAVETALKVGAKIVWLPTMWAANERRVMHGTNDGIEVLDGGKVVPALEEIMRLVAAHDVVLATGHLSPDETLVVVDRAKELGVKKVVITHPEWSSINMPLQVQEKLLPYGVFFERCYNNRPLGEKDYVPNYPRSLEAIKALGHESTVIATDGGQPDAPPWGEALSRYILYLKNGGLSQEAVDVMTKQNPAYLLGLE